MLYASDKKKGAINTQEPVGESPQITRAATTRELIVASLLEQAKALMAEVTQQYHVPGSRQAPVLGSPSVIDGKIIARRTGLVYYWQ